MVVKAKTIIPGQFSTLVVIKLLKEGSDSKARNDFAQEVFLVNQFDHPNILKLWGYALSRNHFVLLLNTWN